MGNGSDPLCYTEVTGQERAVKLVSRNFTKNRLPHGYIFKGPDGVGKQLFARGVAAAVNCRGGEEGRACGSCRSCKKILSGNHPDYIVIRPEQGTLKISQVRDVIRLLEYPPYESKFRVVLLEDVHTMRQEAANSLLKTLEEPPAVNILILTVEGSREILSTLSSRCQVIPFFPLSDEQAVKVLKNKEVELDEDTLYTLARLSEGSPGRALLLHSKGILPVFRDAVEFVATSSADSAKDTVSLLLLAESMAQQKEHLPVILELLRIWFGLLLRNVYTDEVTEKGWFGPELGVQLKNWSCDTLFSRLAAVAEAERKLLRNCNRALVCEVLLFKLQAG